MPNEKPTCPMCGGPMEKREPKKGYGIIRYVCKKEGGEQNCKGWAYGGHKKKEKAAAAASGGVPVHRVPEAPGKAGESPDPDPERRPKPEPKSAGFIDRFLGAKLF
jgi:hypothetical protein